MNNAKRIKFIIVLALLVLVALIVISIFQIISINKMKSQIDSQEQEIATLTQQLNYQNDKTDSAIDSEAGVKEEQ